MAITLGVDVGRTAIKAVAISGGKVPSVLWSARVAADRAEGAELTERLARLRAAAKGPFESVIAALGSDAASLLLFRMPFSSPKLIEQTLAGEVEGLVLASIDDQHLSHQILVADKDGALVAAALAPNAAVEARLATLTQAGLEPRILDLDVAALWTTATALGLGAEPRALVDVGATTTRIVVASASRLVAVRTVAVGGDLVTAALAAKLGLEPADAESRKLELLATCDVSALGDDADDAVAAAARATLRDAYAAIAEDVALSLRAIELKARVTIEKVWLVGGASRARGFDRLVAEHGGLAAEVPAPPDGATAESTAWPEGAVAYGLALRGARSSRGGRGSDLNFRHGGFAYGRDVREITRRVAPLAIPIAAMLIAGLVSFGVRYGSLRRQATAVRAQVIEVFRAEFPEVPIQDPEAQTRQQIGILDKKIAVFAGTAPPAEVLRAISEAAPADVDVTLDGMTLEGGRVTLEGRTDRFESIDKLKTALTGVEPFGEVRVQDQAKDGPQIRFTMVLELAREDAAGGAS
ncbi:MAG: pilus assembly protein PilM [Deltaproteobacteria bacterium]|nr:pilus assembly protein PilM [Deltaproteobacteria bacterium]